MPSGWIRGLLFAFLIAAPIGVAMSGARPEPGADIVETVTHLLEREGARYTGRQSFSGDALTVLSFELANCAQPLQIVPTDRAYQARALFDRVGGAGHTRFFAYLGQVSTDDDAGWSFREHLKHRFLELLALSPYAVDKLMLLVSAPVSCAVPRVDWSQVWNLDYRRLVAAQGRQAE